MVLLGLGVSGCYLSHTPEETPGGDAAVPDMPDVGIPPSPSCVVSLGWCSPSPETYVFDMPERRVSFADMTWTGRVIAVAFDHRGEEGAEPRSVVAALTIDLDLVSQTDVDYIDWPDIAWHRDGDIGIAIGGEQVVALDGSGRPIDARPVEPFGLGAHRATVAPVRDGFLLFVAPASGGALRAFHGAWIDAVGGLPAAIPWETFRDDVHVTNRVIPALDEDGYATYLAGGIFSPQSRILMRIEAGRPGEIVLQDRIGSSAGEPEAAALIENRIFLYQQSVAAALFDELVDEEIRTTHRVDGELLGGPVLPFAMSSEGDAVGFERGLLFAATSSDDQLALVEYQPRSGEASMSTVDIGENTRPMPRLARTSRGYAVAYGCDDDLCVRSVDCCLSE